MQIKCVIELLISIHYLSFNYKQKLECSQRRALNRKFLKKGLNLCVRFSTNLHWNILTSLWRFGSNGFASQWKLMGSTNSWITTGLCSKGCIRPKWIAFSRSWLLWIYLAPYLFSRHKSWLLYFLFVTEHSLPAWQGALWVIMLGCWCGTLKIDSKQHNWLAIVTW